MTFREKQFSEKCNDFRWEMSGNLSISVILIFSVEIVEILVPNVGLRWYLDSARLVVGARSIIDGDFSEPLFREKLFEVSRVLATREKLTMFVLQGDFQPCFFHVVVIVFWLEKIKSFVHVSVFLALRTTSSISPELADLIGIAVHLSRNIVWVFPALALASSSWRLAPPAPGRGEEATPCRSATGRAATGRRRS